MREAKGARKGEQQVGKVRGRGRAKGMGRVSALQGEQEGGATRGNKGSGGGQRDGE